MTAQYCAVLDAKGFPTAFYNDDIYPPTVTKDAMGNVTATAPNSAIPAGAVEITEAQWLECIANNGLRQIVNGALVVYVPPPAAPVVPESISDRQFMQWLATDGDITWAECFAYLGTGVVPTIFANAISQLPAAMQNAATAKFIGAKEFLRHDPETEGLGQLIGKTSADLDAIWTGAFAL